MICLFMLSGAKAHNDFHRKKIETINKYIGMYEMEENTQKKLRNLQLSMLKENLNERITANDVLNHDFFSEFKVKIIKTDLD